MSLLSPEQEGSRHLYRRVAGSIQRLIRDGAYRPGERIPSVRRLSQEQGVSISTVLEAYSLLEVDGWIEARPQSGYFVAPREEHPCAEPSPSRPPLDPAPISTGELSVRVMRDTQNPALVQLGASFPDPLLLPTQRLNRLLATIGRDMPERSVSYDAPPGCRELRLQIARRGLAAGVELDPDQIVTTVGCQEALCLALRAVCRPGDTVAIESPTYYGVLQAIEALGLKALELPTHPKEGLRLDALRFALEQFPIHACVITTFNNPLGSRMAPEALEELARMLAERQIPLIEDDIYGDLSFDAARPHVARQHDRDGLVMLCSSFSKTLAPGYRVGWIAPGRFFRQVEHLKFVSSIGAATLPQLAIAEFLRGGSYERYLRRVRPEYARRVALVGRAIAQHFPAGTCVSRPAGGFVVWVELPGDVDVLQIYSQAIAEGIAFAPGPIFSAAGAYRNCLRLNAACWTPEIEGAIRRLGEIAGSFG